MPATSRPLTFVSRDSSLQQDRANEPGEETANSDSVSTFSVGVRVVRGPDWKSNEAGSDGGEGFVGTVVEIGTDSSSLAENMAMVKWDNGTSEVYRAGYHEKYELCVLDNATAGIKHRGVTCCACKQGPIAGLRWKCLVCKDPPISLCTSCYMADKHDKDHAFVRFDGPGENGTPVDKRNSANKIQARGIYSDAIVTRGAGWEYDDQGGGGFGTVTGITSWQGIPASAARVAWSSGTEGTYRRGYQGKVDLKCITASTGGHYYKSHLPRLGPSQQSTKNANQPGCSSEDDANTLTIHDQTVESANQGTESSNGTSFIDSSGCGDDDTQKPVTDWERRGQEAKKSRRALHEEAIAGQLEAVQAFLDNGEDVNQRDKFSLTPLHLAAWYGQESVVNLLLEHGADVNATDRFQKTALQKAERHNHQPIIQILKRHGATPSFQQPLSLMCLSKMAVLATDPVSGFNLLQASVYEGNYATVKTFSIFLDNFLREMNFESTANNAKISSSKTACDIFSTFKKRYHAMIKAFYEETLQKYGTLTELHRCGDNDDAEKAVELVLNHGMDVNIAAKGNRTPLLWASLRCSGVFIKTLIDLGADTNAQREDQCTSLIMAAYWNNYMAIRLLAHAGVSTDYIQDESYSALHISAMGGFVNITKLLIEAGSNVNLQSSGGRTPLHLAVQNRHKHLVKTLLESNADANIRDKYQRKDNIFLVRGKDKGKPAWHYVDVKRATSGLFHKKTKDGSIDVADFGTVLASGWGEDPPADKREEIVTADDKPTAEMKNKTALHIACKVGDEEVIKLLVEHGADINACDGDGFTSLHLAAIHGNMQVVKKLVELKVDVSLTTADGKDAADYAQMNEESEIEEYLKSKKSPLRKLWNRLSRK